MTWPARILLLKLERRGLILLPARQRPSTNHLRNRVPPKEVPAGKPVRGSLRDLRPLSATLVEPCSDDMRLFNGLLASHHYLMHRNTVGENLRYLVRDQHARPVACLLFGWSEKGAAKMARIVINRFLNKCDWDEYWKKKLRLEGNVRFFLRDISLCSPTISGR